jgi:hypothetical protein
VINIGPSSLAGQDDASIFLSFCVRNDCLPASRMQGLLQAFVCGMCVSAVCGSFLIGLSSIAVIQGRPGHHALKEPVLFRCPYMVLRKFRSSASHELATVMHTLLSSAAKASVRHFATMTKKAPDSESKLAQEYYARFCSGLARATSLAALFAPASAMARPLPLPTLSVHATQMPPRG